MRFDRKSLRFLQVYLAVFFLMVALCQGVRADDFSRFLVRAGWYTGSGGAVGRLNTFAVGGEYELWHQDKLAISVSSDWLLDRSVDGLNRSLFPVLANVRWYADKQSSGLYVAGGLGAAFPVGVNHGNSTFAWEGSLGYVTPSKVFLEGRYIGRSGQNGGFNNQFLGGFAGYLF